MNFRLPRIYPITDTRISGVSHSEQVKKLIAGGAALVQLREKHTSPNEFYQSAAQAIAIAREGGVKIIINDRVDIALALEADGVHLGQDDLPPDEARKILGENAIIGLSTHTSEQSRRAGRFSVDYITIGPIFQTETKQNSDAIVGLEGLGAARAAVGKIPLVAIGGINLKNLKSVFAAGADSAAMIAAIVSDPAKMEERTEQFFRAATHEC